MATAASLMAWGLWLASWMLAAPWSARTLARSISPLTPVHWGLTIAGWALMFHGVGDNGYNHYLRPAAGTGDALPAPLPWLLFGLVIAGLAFSWWARLHLGRLWSASITRKADHRVVDTGPYRLVRHPIYTGLIAASIALAAQEATALAFAGAALVTAGFWIKASLEERFLREELGPADYDAYRARTPMLAPFTRWRGDQGAGD